MQTTKILGLKKPETNDFYNVNDFNGNADALDGLFEKDANGTVAVKNTTKLDGHGVEYFATAESVSNIVSGKTKVSKATTADSATKATKDSNGNDISKTYATNKKVEELLAGIETGETPMGNASALGGETAVEWQKKIDNITDGTTKVGNADKLDGHEVEEFIRTAKGGTVTGALNIDSAVFGANVRSTSLEKGTLPSSTAYLSVNLMEKGGTTHKNRVGQLQTSVDTSGNVQTTINAFKFEKDGSTAQSLGVVCTPDGNGYGFAPTPSNASDNSNKIATTKWVNGFALPRDGSVPIAKNGRKVLTINNTHPTSATASTIAHMTNGTLLGELGIDVSYGAIYKDASEKNYQLLHTGNSTKVHVNSSAPSDTSSVWFDTSEL